MMGPADADSSSVSELCAGSGFLLPLLCLVLGLRDIDVFVIAEASPS